MGGGKILFAFALTLALLAGSAYGLASVSPQNQNLELLIGESKLFQFTVADSSGKNFNALRPLFLPGGCKDLFEFGVIKTERTSNAFTALLKRKSSLPIPPGNCAVTFNFVESISGATISAKVVIKRAVTVTAASKQSPPKTASTGSAASRPAADASSGPGIKKIVVYGAAYCAPCQAEKAFLERNKLIFEYVEVSSHNYRTVQAAIKPFKGMTVLALPNTIVTDISGKSTGLIGFDKQELTELLNRLQPGVIQN